MSATQNLTDQQIIETIGMTSTEFFAFARTLDLNERRRVMAVRRRLMRGQTARPISDREQARRSAVVRAKNAQREAERVAARTFISFADA